MASVPVLDATGTKVGTRDLSAAVFEAPVSVPLMHQVVVARPGEDPPRHALHEDPRRGVGRGPQAMAPEGHRARAAGLEPRSPSGPAAASRTARIRATTTSG